MKKGNIGGKGLGALILLLVSTAAAVAFATTRPLSAPIDATAASSFSQLLIRGSQWLGGHGVDVYSNGTNPSYFSGQSNYLRGIYTGVRWQCVELAQRLYTDRGWHRGSFGVQYAYQIYDRAPALGMKVYPNGSGYVPLPGDLIVVGKSASSTAGHVVVVDAVYPDRIAVIEQNWGYEQTGRGYFVRRGATVSRGSLPIRGFVHDPDNRPTGPTPPPTPRDTVRPRGELSSPMPGSTPLVGGTVTVAGNFADDRGIAKVSFYVADDSYRWKAIGTDAHGGNGRYGVRWTVDYPPGTNLHFHAHAWDTAGNEGIDTVEGIDGVRVWSPTPTIRPSSPTPVPASSAPPSAPPSRTAITSYDEMRPGAPHHGYFDSAWQGFAAKSNTITFLGVTVGTPAYEPGARTPAKLRVRLCTDVDCSSALADRMVPIINYGNSAIDLGDVAVASGLTYFVRWEQPPPAPGGRTWVTYWWAGGSSIGSSDRMQAVVRGYDR